MSCMHVYIYCEASLHACTCTYMHAFSNMHVHACAQMVALA